VTGGPKIGRTLAEEDERKLFDHMLQRSGMFHGEFCLSYSELHASLENDKM
jgi:hypothetical protein